MSESCRSFQRERCQKMQFLVDECLALGLAVRLTSSGHDAIHVTDRDLAGRPDEEVLGCALAERRILVSADTDFGEILAHSRGRAPSVILFRRADRTPESLHEVLIGNLPAIANELAAGAVAVITDNRLRVRRLPLR